MARSIDAARTSKHGLGGGIPGKRTAIAKSLAGNGKTKLALIAYGHAHATRLYRATQSPHPMLHFSLTSLATLAICAWVLLLVKAMRHETVKQ